MTKDHHGTQNQRLHLANVFLTVRNYRFFILRIRCGLLQRRRSFTVIYARIQALVSKDHFRLPMDMEARETESSFYLCQR